MLNEVILRESSRRSSRAFVASHRAAIPSPKPALLRANSASSALGQTLLPQPLHILLLTPTHRHETDKEITEQPHGMNQTDKALTTQRHLVAPSAVLVARPLVGAEEHEALQALVGHALAGEVEAPRRGHRAVHGAARAPALLAWGGKGVLMGRKMPWEGADKQNRCASCDRV